MKIYKIKCEICGYKYTANKRCHHNPSISLDRGLSKLVIDGLLLLNVRSDGTIRTYCTNLIKGTVCNGRLVGYYIKVKNKRKKDDSSDKNKKPTSQ